MEIRVLYFPTSSKDVVIKNPQTIIKKKITLLHLPFSSFQHIL